MSTFLKIGLGFVLGVICTLGVLYAISIIQNTEENQLRDEIRIQALKSLNKSLNENNRDVIEEQNIQSFELTTKKGIVKLRTYMHKDSVKILMGRPQTTNIHNNELNGKVEETWKYKGSNKYVDEFTIEFSNGKLISVRQFKDH